MSLYLPPGYSPLATPEGGRLSGCCRHNTDTWHALGSGPLITLFLWPLAPLCSPITPPPSLTTAFHSGHLLIHSKQLAS